MQDADRDGRADRLRITFSEQIRHRADRDGRYPIVVRGYKIRSLSPARGRTLVATLVERAAPDAGSAPAVRYVPTRSKPVLDLAGNQAVRQVFRKTKPLRPAPGSGVAVPPPAPPPPPPDPTLAPDADPDRDGYAAPLDCQPGNPAVHPGAEDLPDLAFADTNCDGIDGTEGDAIFASPLGKDTNPGTKAMPKRQIQAAVDAAALTGRYVLAAGGDYGPVTLTSGVSIYGGYGPETWARAADIVTHITGSPEGVLADRATGVVLQHLLIEANAPAIPGASAYGIRAIRNSSLTLQRVKIGVGPGRTGRTGALGADGAKGNDGVNGGTGSCDGGVPGLGGQGGKSPIGRAGGMGGSGGTQDLIGGSAGQPGQPSSTGTPGGSGGAAGNPGKPGGKGQDGADGSPGTMGVGGTNATALASLLWRGVDGSSGTAGAPGHGGGGGGGGGAQTGLFVDDGAGNGGGGGGAGGAGGGGGKGGGAGGGSFGVYLYDAKVLLESSQIFVANGGAGGEGGGGGAGGAGGKGGAGGASCTSQIGRGGDGGDGGDGGRGGGGGGGAGGPSVGVMKLGASEATLTDTTITVGQGGAGGRPGAGGVPGPLPGRGQDGISAEVYPAS